MLTSAERVDIRRYCGYGMYGLQALPANGYRFSTAYGTLEYKMTNMLSDEEIIARTYITKLKGLEDDITGSSENLDTDQAAVWTHNKNEVRDRVALYDYTRRQLCGFMGITPGPELDDGGVRWVV